MSLTAAEIEKLIPHSGAMSLLGAALEWDRQRIRCSASSHRDPLNPLRGEAGLSSIRGLEYAAQGMAVHGALIDENNAAQAGLLISVRDVRLMVQRLDDIPHDLIIDAEILIADDTLFSYQFRISANDMDLITGQAAVMFLRKST